MYKDCSIAHLVLRILCLGFSVYVGHAGTALLAVAHFIDEETFVKKG